METWQKTALVGAVVAAVAALVALVIWLIKRGRGAKKTLEPTTPPSPVAVTVTPAPGTTSTMATTPKPWGVCFTKDGQYMFVGGRHLVVYRRTGMTFTEVRRVVNRGVFHGLALSNSGALLATGNDTSVTLFDVAKLLDPTADAFLRSTPTKKGASEVLFSSDDAALFVTLEYDQGVLALGVPALQQTRRISADRLPVGMALHTLAGKPVVLFTAQVKPGRPYCPTADCSGTLSAIDVAALSKAVSVDVGCCPVRVDSNGERVFVTARGEDRVKVLDKSLQPIGQIPTGPAPVGVKLAAGGTVLVVTASNRFSSDPGLVHFFDAVTLEEIATIPAQRFPRGVAVAPDGLVAVTNFTSGTLMLVNLPPLMQQRVQQQQQQRK